LDIQKIARNSYIKVIGAGPGSIDYFTLKLIKEVKSADFIVGDRRILELIKFITDSQLIYLKSDKNLYNMIDNVKDLSGNIVVLSTGDPMLAGLGKFFNNSEVYPGISSIQLCASILHKSLNESAIVSVRYGSNYDKIVAALNAGFRVFILPNPYLDLKENFKKIILSGVGPDKNGAVCNNLGLTNEKILKGRISELMQYDVSGLSIIFIEP